MSCFLIWPLNETHRQSVCVYMCICVYVAVCYCVQRDTLINMPHLGKWWSKRAPASVNTGSAAQIEMEGNEDLCDGFHPDGGYNGSGVCPGRPFLSSPSLFPFSLYFQNKPFKDLCVQLLKHCSFTAAAPHLHQLTAAWPRDADGAQKVTWKGTVPFGRVFLFLEARRLNSWDSVGFPTLMQLLVFVKF